MSIAISGEKELPKPHYALIDTSLDGLPVVLIVNSALVDFKAKEDFPWHLSIIIRFKGATKNGMPTRNESMIVTELSEQLERHLTSNNNSLFLARQTWNGEKQLLLRVSNPETADSILRTLTNTHNTREWEYRMEHDDHWEFAKIYFDVLAKAK